MAVSVVRTMPENLIQKWQFALEINGFNVALFQKADRPKVEFDEVEFNPAGSHRPQKLPGRVKFEDVTLENGIPADGAMPEALNWMMEQIDFVNGNANADSGTYLRDVAIVEHDRNRDEVTRWNLHGAWVKKYDGGDLVGADSENVIETLTITYQYFTRD